MQCALLRTQLQIRYLPLRQNASGYCFISYHAFDKFPTKFFENGELPPVDTPWRRKRAGRWTLCFPRAATPGPSWSRLSSARHSRRHGGAQEKIYPVGRRTHPGRYAVSKTRKNYFPTPNEIFSLGLSPGEFAVCSYLLRCADWHTHQCWPSHKTIGAATQMAST